MAPGEVPDSAPERQSGDPRRGDDPARGREAERVGRMVEVAPGAAALRADELRGGVDADPPHPAQVHDHGAVRGAEAGDAVAPAADRDAEARGTRRLHRGDDVGNARAPHNGGGTLVNHRVVDPPRLVEVVIRREDDLPSDLTLKLLQ